MGTTMVLIRKFLIIYVYYLDRVYKEREGLPKVQNDTSCLNNYYKFLLMFSKDSLFLELQNIYGIEFYLNWNEIYLNFGIFVR